MTVITEADGTVIITPEAESIDDAVNIIGETARRLVQEGNNRIIFDMVNVKFIGFIGISLLIKINNMVLSKGGQIRILRLHHDVQVMYKMNKLDKIFEIIPSP